MKFKSFIKSLILLLVGINLFFVSCSKEPIIETSLNKYLQTDNNVSRFLIFPDIDITKGKVKEYYLKKFPPAFLGYDYEIFLRINYTEQFFNEEIERLSMVVSDWSGKETAKDENCVLFNSVTIVSTYWIADESNEFEYASINFEQKEIVYVYIKNLAYNELSIDSIYLPKFYTKKDSQYESYRYRMDTICDDNWIEDAF